jgi:hypothetical protein
VFHAPGGSQERRCVVDYLSSATRVLADTCSLGTVVRSWPHTATAFTNSRGTAFAFLISNFLAPHSAGRTHPHPRLGRCSKPPDQPLHSAGQLYPRLQSWNRIADRHLTASTNARFAMCSERRGSLALATSSYSADPSRRNLHLAAVGLYRLGVDARRTRDVGGESAGSRGDPSFESE